MHGEAVGGSSPRVRGAESIFSTQLPRPGIIPARAGSRVSRIRGACRPPDHPRACGEQQMVIIKCENVEGSSPRVRGADDTTSAVGSGLGIIPARAGSSVSITCILLINSKRDHPRACGEQAETITKLVLPAGSSPRVRGAGDAWKERRSLVGIIPARAGSRPPPASSRRLGGDHPRACGEQTKKSQFKAPYPFDVGPILISLINKLKVASQSDSAR